MQRRAERNIEDIGVGFREECEEVMEHLPKIGWGGRVQVIGRVKERGEDGGCSQDGMGEIERYEGDAA